MLRGENDVGNVGIKSFFLKSELNLVEQASFFSVEQLVDSYFGNNPKWNDFLNQVIVINGLERKTQVIDIAYDIKETAESVYNKKFNWYPTIILPETNLKRDLNFYKEDYAMFQGALKLKYVPVDSVEFRRIEKVSECIEYILAQPLSENPRHFLNDVDIA